MKTRSCVSETERNKNQPTNKQTKRHMASNPGPDPLTNVTYSSIRTLNIL